jgi:ubiquinone/menaquinone biosynthesis C-methylase UbiE
MFFKRENITEMMDDFSIRDDRIDAALKELQTINKYLGGEKTSNAGFKKLRKKLSPGDRKVLDVGSGASSILVEMQKINTNLEIYSMDKNIQACRYLKKNSTNIKIVCADIFYLPFKQNYFDIIHCSLLFHHFNKSQLKTILNFFTKIAKHGIIINDLRRNLFAFIGIKILTILFSRSEMVRNDAPISVMRGFIKEEIMELLFLSNISRFEIRRKWAFRWLIIIYFDNYEIGL